MEYVRFHAMFFHFLFFLSRVDLARDVLRSTLKLWPANGVALVHYGFILKTIDNNLEEAVLHMQKGVDTKENGTLEGRFLFHLGDALARLGRQNEASEVRCYFLHNNILKTIFNNCFPIDLSIRG